MPSVDRLREFREKINIDAELRLDEPMRNHTSFRVGGPADIYVEPRKREDLETVLREADATGIPVFILGGGANILVSDRGIRGLVVNLSGLRAIEITGNTRRAEAGRPVSDAAETAAAAGLAGLDFLYAMPGSVGGAVWMNARCYEGSVSDVLETVRYVDEDIRVREAGRGDAAFMNGFGYKKSPFQGTRRVILEAVFELRREPRESIRARMLEIRRDRTAKGHFIAPSAGSVFKNNRDFGEPSGAIIDRLGFRGYSQGGAAVSPIHANIIINSGNATAADIRRLIETIGERVRRELGYTLEREVLYVGDWDEDQFRPR